MARRVVDVGTPAFVMLLQGRDHQDPAVPAGEGGHQISVWRATCRPARNANPGEGVVNGPRLMNDAAGRCRWTLARAHAPGRGMAGTTGGTARTEERDEC